MVSNKKGPFLNHDQDGYLEPGRGYEDVYDSSSSSKGLKESQVKDPSKSLLSKKSVQNSSTNFLGSRIEGDFI